MIQLCPEKEVRDMKKYVKLFFTLMVCFTLSFSLYSAVSAQEKPTVTDDSETVVEEIPEDPTLTDEPEETTEITTPEETEPSTEETAAQTNIGLMLSLASMAVTGAFIIYHV
ncbi:MAG: hypothetical protein U0M88_00315 [Faecalicoccus sp.]|uniref:hypothetical protein n=1 Tax=Faecalicoccus sp. TaxID=1971758 RepID=UPI002F92E1FE